MAKKAQLQLIEIPDFPTTATLAGSGQEFVVITKADGTTYKMLTSDFKAFLGTVTVSTPKPIGPADGTPELDGVYIPTVTQNEGGTPVVYANFGGLEVNTSEGGDDYGTSVQFLKNGAVYAKVNTEIPMQDLSNYVNNPTLSQTVTDILDLNTDAFKTIEILPEDRSDVNFELAENSTAIYFEKVNHKGITSFFIKADSAGQVTVHYFTINNNFANVLHSIEVDVISGINEFSNADLELTALMLDRPTFYLGIQPSITGLTRYTESTNGALSVVSLPGSGISDTTHKNCTWFKKETSQHFVLEDYPETKDIVTQTVNLEPGEFRSSAIPENRNEIIMGVSGSSTMLYGESEIFVNNTKPLHSLHVFAIGSGNVLIYFIKINEGVAEIMHTTQKFCTVGLNTFSADILGVVSLIASTSDNLYILCGNDQDQIENPIHGDSNYNKTRPWYAMDKSTEVLQTINSNQRFSFYISTIVPYSPLVTEVKRVASLVDSGSLNSKRWFEKQGVSFGDSITWYDGQVFNPSHIEAGQTVIGYQHYIREYFNCTIDNQGESGWTMPQIMTRLKAYDFSNVDFVTITSGANDHRLNVPPGVVGGINGIFDTSTYGGSMQSSIEYILNQNKKCKIYLITPIKGFFIDTSGVYENDPVLSRDYADVVHALGRLYAIPVCNWYDESFINEINRTYYIGDDPSYPEIPYYLHPTNAGYKLMGETVCRFMENY